VQVLDGVGVEVLESYVYNSGIRVKFGGINTKLSRFFNVK